TRCAVYWEFIESNQPFENEMELWEKELNRLETSFDNTWSGFDQSESQKLKAFRHAVPELVNAIVANNKRKCPNVRKISTDSSMPKHHFREWLRYCIEHLEQEKIQYAAFGHLGDFHLHINMLPSTEKQFDTALALYHDFMFNSCKKGGSISAEHGVGKIKRDFLGYMYDSSAINQMKKIKQALDPNFLLNNGTLFS
ncbi:MAG: FAD-linked oxidase C-terminal domain-containing protein, partial [Fibrobacter sp.]|nr:FAD-linked oxidase C-terminal domain-containing protein [Fibrobacter sp.]